MNTYINSSDATSTRFRLLEEGDIAVAAGVYARAFHNEPLSQYALPDERVRFKALKALFERFLLYGVRHGEVQTPVGPVKAGAIWLGPTEWDFSDEKLVDAGFDDELAGILGPDAGRRFDDYFTWMHEQQQRFAPREHLYLAAVAVDVEWQGKGVGSSLIRNMTRRADETGMACYLETQELRNVPLYMRLGFQVVQDTVEPVSGLRAWSFLRQPQ